MVNKTLHRKLKFELHSALMSMTRYLRVWISKMSEKKTQYVTWGLLFKLDGTIKIELSILVWYKTEVSSFH
jgi:hypothetical protein